jgi:hypothetical protein
MGLTINDRKLINIAEKFGKILQRDCNSPYLKIIWGVAVVGLGEDTKYTEYQ